MDGWIGLLRTALPSEGVEGYVPVISGVRVLIAGCWHPKPDCVTSGLELWLPLAGVSTSLEGFPTPST